MLDQFNNNVDYDNDNEKLQLSPMTMADSDWVTITWRIGANYFNTSKTCQGNFVSYPGGKLKPLSPLLANYYLFYLFKGCPCPSLLKQALLNTSRGQIDDINHLQVVHSVLNKNMVWFVILSEGWPTCSDHNQSEPFKHSTTVHDYQLHLTMAN